MNNAARRLAAIAALLALPVSGAAPAVAGRESAAPLSKTCLRIGEGTAAPCADVARLRARPDVRRIALPASLEPYGGPVDAVPLASLVPTDRDLGFRASDAFVAVIPKDLFRRAREAGIVPWIAVEDRPWQMRAGRRTGPFALIWTGDPAHRIVAQEQWVDSLEAVFPASKAGLPPAASAEEQRGCLAFAANCAPCHRLDGAGEGALGPDLGTPVNATLYLTRPGFDAIVRDPRAVRRWPAERMGGFSSAALPDADLDAIWAYLASLRAGSGTAK